MVLQRNVKFPTDCVTCGIYSVSKKVSPFMFDNNFGNCGPKCAPHLQYVATLPSEIQKCYQIFTLNMTINMFN